MDPDEKLISKRVNFFFKDMKGWEALARKLSRLENRGEISYSGKTQVLIESLVEIFKIHCATTKMPARAQGGTLQFDLIRTYGPDIEKILSIEISEDQARVVTQNHRGPCNKFVYRLTKIDGDWKIKDNRKFIAINGKELPSDL